jgi:hypothetical protein
MIYPYRLLGHSSWRGFLTIIWSRYGQQPEIAAESLKFERLSVGEVLGFCNNTAHSSITPVARATPVKRFAGKRICANFLTADTEVLIFHHRATFSGMHGPFLRKLILTMA